jgi:gliding motility-associated-like protein
MRILLLIWIQCLPVSGYAQSQGNIWAFGDHAGLGFNSGVALPVSTDITGFGEACASICDAAGQLLFYTEGSNIWNRNGAIMPGGADVTGLPYIISLYTPTSSSSQGALIIPIPDTPGKYYVFSLSSQPSEMGINAGRLYYSVVDMNLDGGMGAVDPGRRGVLIDSGLTEKMTAVVGDRCNIWLMVHRNNTTDFKAYEIDGSGLNLVPVISSVGSTSQFLYTVGTMKFSPNRKKLATGNILTLLFAGIGSFEMFDFNPASGIVSNPVLLSGLANYGACFSADNSKLYSTEYNSGKINQYDLNQTTPAAIIASKTEIGTGRPTDLKTGPDGKVYLAGSLNTSGNGEFLTVINAPNNPGAACLFTPNAIQLLPGTSMNIGLPNEIALFKRDSVYTSRKITVCFKDSIQLMSDSASIGWDHFWDGGETDKDIMVDSSGNYIAHYHTPPCVYHTDTFKVDFASPIPSYGAFAGCKGTGNSFLWVLPRSGDVNLYTYSWKDSLGNPLRTTASTIGDTFYINIPGTYSVNMSAANGCDTSFTIKLNIPDYKASFTTDSILCIGDSARFINTSTGFSSFTWYFGDGDISSLHDPVHLYSDPGVYKVLLIGNPCGDTAISIVTLDTMSYASFIVDASTFCEGKALTFYPSHPEGVDTLIWDFGDQTTISSMQPAVHAYDTSGFWIVKLIVRFRACPDTSFKDTVAIYPYPRIDLGPDSFLCVNGSPLLLYNHIAPTAPLTFSWNTGDVTPSIVAVHPGIYELTVTSELECASTDSIEIYKGCYLDIPNAFTPDGDGSNDYFLPRQELSHRLTGFRMQVFNRWGQLIFETDRIDGRGWDGRFNNLDQPAGVYVYLIEAVIDGVVNEKYKGNITLIR